MYKKKVQMWKAKTSMHITHDNEWGMGEVAKRLGSQLLMHQAKVKQHQQRDVNTETNSVYNSVLLNNLTYTVHSVAVGGSVKVIFLIIPWKKNTLFFNNTLLQLYAVTATSTFLLLLLHSESVSSGKTRAGFLKLTMRNVTMICANSDDWSNMPSLSSVGWFVSRIYPFTLVRFANAAPLTLPPEADQRRSEIFTTRRLRDIHTEEEAENWRRIPACSHYLWLRVIYMSIC